MGYCRFFTRNIQPLGEDHWPSVSGWHWDFHVWGGGSDDSKDVPGKWGDATASGEAFPLTSAPDPRSPSRDLPTAVSLCLSAQMLDSGSSVLVKGRINLAGYVGQRTFVFTPHSFFFLSKICCCGNSLKNLRNFKMLNLGDNKERQSLLNSERVWQESHE